MNVSDVPPEREWVNIETETRIHPYEMHKIASLDYVEVINRETDDTGTIKRWVLFRDGKYEVWVKAAARDAYGYAHQPDEQVSNAEREAITLKCDAIETDRTVGADPTVSLGDAMLRLTDELNQDDPDLAVAGHLLIATYYAAKQEPALEDSFVDDLRELVHEQTGHVDTSHPETLRETLDSAVNGDTNHD